MAINIYSLDGYVLGSGGNIEALAGTSVDLSSWDQSTYQWSDDTDGPGNFSQIQDLDTLGAGDSTSMTPTAQEGVLVNGTLVQVETFVSFSASEITFADGSSMTLDLAGHELADGTMLLQFSNAQIAALNAAGYDRKDIRGIELGTITYGRTRAAGNFESSFPFCFTPGTTILTEDGLCAVEDLRPGDEVATLRGRKGRVIWIGRSAYLPEDLADNDKLLPIRIKASALGANIPDRDLVVSRQHRLYVESAIAQRMFGTPGVLIAAKDLLDHSGVQKVHASECEQGLNYIHVLLDHHGIMFANGAPAESLLLAEQGVQAIGPATRSELQAFLERPEAVDAAAQVVCGSAVRNLVARHIRNRKPLLSEC